MGPVWGTSAFPMTFSQSGSFSDAAKMNQQLYGNIQAAHVSRIAQVSAAQNNLNAGYTGLSNAVLRRLRGSNRANIIDINQKMKAAGGQGQIDLIARGLGNSSILGDLVRGIESDRARELTRSRGLFAQLQAGMQKDIGLAGLSSRGQGIGLMAGLLGDQIASLERVSAPYPTDDTGFGSRGSSFGGVGASVVGGGPIGGRQPAGLFAPSYTPGYSVGGGDGRAYFNLPEYGGGGYGGGYAAPAGGSSFDFAGAGSAIMEGVYGGMPSYTGQVIGANPDYQDIGLGAGYYE